jgi:ubiquinone/menaquinone biosynthesis C-methylase UbiE
MGKQTKGKKTKGKNRGKAVTPEPISESLWAPLATRALIAGTELGVFSLIAEGIRTADDIAVGSKAGVRGIRMLLDALAALGYLKKKGDRYGLEPIADTFLVKGRPSYMGDLVVTLGTIRVNWDSLTDSVRSGKPIATLDAEQAGREFFPKLVAGLFAGNYNAAQTVAASLSPKSKKSVKDIMDVAAGSGAWSIPFAQAIPGAKVTVVDFPEVTPVTRQFTEKCGVSNQYDYVEANLREADFGRSKFDLIILGHIIHSEGEKWGKKLVNKSYDALRPGGMLLIAELITDDSRSHRWIPHIFGLNMLMLTTDGGVFTMREYQHWLKDTGFRKVKVIEAPAPSPLILATK